MHLTILALGAMTSRIDESMRSRHAGLTAFVIKVTLSYLLSDG